MPVADAARSRVAICQKSVSIFALRSRSRKPRSNIDCASSLICRASCSDLDAVLPRQVALDLEDVGDELLVVFL